MEYIPILKIQHGITEVLWQLFNNGILKTGWLKSGNSWYFLDNSGAIKTDWFKDNGKYLGMASVVSFCNFKHNYSFPNINRLQTIKFVSFLSFLYNKI